MRKHVTPADPKACIPDPSRGRDLPPGGAEVDWTPYWAGMEARAEVTVRDVEDEPATPAETDPAPAEPEPHEEPDSHPAEQIHDPDATEPETRAG